MSKGEHLTLDDRKSIQIGLQEGRNFQEIAREIGKDPSTVSKEIRKHRVARRTASFNPCIKAKDCYHDSDICFPCRRYYHGYCRRCPVAKCYETCPDFSQQICRRVKSAPYVCNGCSERRASSNVTCMMRTKHRKRMKKLLAKAVQGLPFHMKSLNA